MPKEIKALTKEQRARFEEWAKAIHQAIGIESPVRFVLVFAFVGFVLFGGAAWIVDRGYRVRMAQEAEQVPVAASPQVNTTNGPQRAGLAGKWRKR